MHGFCELLHVGSHIQALEIVNKITLLVCCEKQIIRCKINGVCEQSTETGMVVKCNVYTCAACVTAINWAKNSTCPILGPVNMQHYTDIVA